MASSGVADRLFQHHFRFHAPHAHLSSAFGDSWFGAKAEGFARLFGTPTLRINTLTDEIHQKLVSPLS